MPRVKRGVTARAAHKKVLAQAKGFRGRRENVFRIAKEAVMKAGQYAYRDRRDRKREFRALWIARINAAARELGMSYSAFMNGLKKAAIEIDRKVLADLAVADKAAFAKIAEQAKAQLGGLSRRAASQGRLSRLRRVAAALPLAAMQDVDAIVAEARVAVRRDRRCCRSSRTRRRAISASPAR